MEKNTKIAAGIVAPKGLSADKAEARAMNGRQRDQRTPEERIGLAAQVAQNTMHVRNWKYKNADKHFPYDPLARRVDKYFQNAKGGPLYVDEPMEATDLERCKKKAKVMAIEGLRYCFIEREAKLSDVLKQLETKIVKGKSA